MIQNDYTFAAIARKMDRSASTISREILHYRCFIDPLRNPGENDCIRNSSCTLPFRKKMPNSRKRIYGWT